MCSSLKIIVLSEDLILWYYVLSLCLLCLWMYWITQHCDYDVHVLSYALSNKWFEFEFELKIYISELSSIIPISIQVLISDLVFPVYKIDREQSEKMFLRNVWRYQRGIQKTLRTF
jgi:hypothetical protein